MADAPERTRCTCEWAHPVDGTIDVNWPAELDPHCEIHGEPMGFPESLVAALEQECEHQREIINDSPELSARAEVERLRAAIREREKPLTPEGENDE